MQFTSTRNNAVSVSGFQAISNGISVDGGLYVPSSFPTVSAEELEAFLNKTYPERAAFILSKYLEFGYDELLSMTEAAYSRFKRNEVCPLVKTVDDTFILELTHGPTLAFKDVALTLLPHLLTNSNKKLGVTDKTLILVATSGDTGKAALEGFKDVEGIEIIVFYPADGVSDMQKKQMQTQEGKNVHVFGIRGNFDDAQSAVKRIFTSGDVKNKLKDMGYILSSANSINFGRLAPQIVYYFSAYADLVNAGEIELGAKINFAVPSGNFGNILAGYYAKRMGLPIDKLICASNKNKVLTDFFTTGEYDVNREFYVTMSPSMDILVSSNLERLLYELSGRNAETVRAEMESLKENGKYKVDIEKLSELGFEAGFADENDTKMAIDSFFDINDYPLDTHTAVAVTVFNDYVARSGDETPTVVVSTASPYKFPVDVYNALAHAYVTDTYEACKRLNAISGEGIPEEIQSLLTKTVRHTELSTRIK
jgi:threonine synthase